MENAFIVESVRAARPPRIPLGCSTQVKRLVYRLTGLYDDWFRLVVVIQMSRDRSLHSTIVRMNMFELSLGVLMYNMYVFTLNK
jgi:hypothetical protein